MKQSLNIFYAIGKYFITYFSVSLTSLLENNKHLDLRIFLIYDFEETDLLNDVVLFAENKYGVRLNLVYQDSSIFDNYRVDKHVSRNTYLRLLVADIIPANINAGLFIDSDTVVTGSLSALAEIGSDMEENKEGKIAPYIYAVEEVREQSAANSKRISDLGFKTDKYFNAGVMMINLKRWRENNISAKLINMSTTYMDDLLYWDQDVLNMFFVNQWQPLDATYNALHLIWKRPEVPLIIHYAGASKPWNYLDRHPYKSCYFRYLKLTPFKEKKYADFSYLKMPYKYYRDARHFLNYFRQSFLGNINKKDGQGKLII